MTEMTMGKALTAAMRRALADDEKIVLTKVGDVRIFVIADGKKSTVLLTNVYFASSLACNIVSYGKLDATDGAGAAWLHAHGEVLDAQADGLETTYEVRLSEADYDRFIRRDA